MRMIYLRKDKMEKLDLIIWLFFWYENENLKKYRKII